SATYLCPAVAAQQCHQSVPRGCASQCPAVLPVSANYQCYQYPSPVPPIRDTSLVLPISAAYP
ncbi:unnamed protein product, partial [Staurois parvus]